MKTLRISAVALLFSLPATTLLGTSWTRISCQDVKSGNEVYCMSIGAGGGDCVAKKPDPGAGSCCTAEKCFKEKLKPGEQMCCTGEKLVKMALGPDQRLVCGQRMFWILEDVKPADDACCISEEYAKNHDDWKAKFQGYTNVGLPPGLPCIVLHNRDVFRNQRLGCTATEVVVKDIGPGNDIACTTEDCYRYNATDKVIGAQVACKRFKRVMNLPRSENSKPTLHLLEDGDLEALTTGPAVCKAPSEEPGTQ